MGPGERVVGWKEEPGVGRAWGRSLPGVHRAETGVSPGRSGGEGAPGLLGLRLRGRKGWWGRPLAGQQARELSWGRAAGISCRAEWGLDLAKGKTH